MPSLETLTEKDVSVLLTSANLRKAHDYLHRVQSPVRAGQTLSAQVRGTSLYEVEVSVEPSGVAAHCNCPYFWGGAYCKHIGAVLLKWIRSPEAFDSRAVQALSEQQPLEVIPVEPPPVQRPKEHPSWLTMPFVKRQQADRQQLERWVDVHRLQDLRQIVKLRNWPIRGTSKAFLTAQVAEYMTRPGEILRTFMRLDQKQQHVLRAMVVTGDDRGIHGENMAAAAAWTRLQPGQIDGIARHLREIGLTLPGYAAGSYPPRGDFVPRGIARSLPPVLAGVVPILDAPPSGDVRLADPYPFVRAAGQVTLLLEQAPVPLRPPMPRPQLERLYTGLKDWDYDPAEVLELKRTNRLRQHANLTLSVPPPAYPLPDDVTARLSAVTGGPAQLEFTFALLQAAGLLQPGSPTTVWPEVRESFLQQDEILQRAVLARTYLGMENWSELWALLRSGKLQLRRAWIQEYLKPQHLYADLVRFRGLVVRALACLPDGRWIALDELLRVLQPIWPRFDLMAWQTYRPAPMPPGWFLTRPGNGEPLQPGVPEDWDLAQGEFVRQVISGPLHWLGLADLSIDGERLVGVRFQGLADLYWDRVEAPPAAHQSAARSVDRSALNVEGADQLSVSVDPVAVSAQAHAVLDLVARLDVTTRERFVYTLDVQAVYETFEAGTGLSEIRERWEHVLGLPVPDPILAQLTRWWEAYGRVRIYEDLTVIEFNDDYTLPEVKAVTSLDEHLIAEISPRLVLISRDAVATLKAELEKAGYTPKETEGA